MNISKLVPASRIEIRPAGSAKDAAWTVAELCHSDNHVRQKLPFWKKNQDIEVRAVPNFKTQADTPVILPDAEAAPETMSPTLPPPAIVATAPAVIAPVVAGAPEATAAASPELPFGPGDQLRDINVADHPPLFVDQINPDGRPGFSWTMPTHPIEANRQGFVALTSVGNYEKVPAGNIESDKLTPSAEAAPEKKAAAKRTRKPKTPKPAPAPAAEPPAAEKTPAPKAGAKKTQRPPAAARASRSRKSSAAPKRKHKK